MEDERASAQVLNQIISILSDLDEDTRNRGVKTVMTFFHLEPGLPTESSRFDQPAANERNPRPSFSADTSPTPKEFLLEKQPRINRMGQFYYFAKSELASRAIASVDDLIPTIRKFMVFRNKHTAHRSIDAPRGESDASKIAHLRAVSTVMGSIFSPKPGAPQVELAKGDFDPAEFQRELWKNNYRTFQTYDDSIGSGVNFTLEVQHPTIVAETYEVVERVILHE